MRWTPDTIIAAGVLLGCFIMIGLGIDSEVKSIMTIAAGWIFASQYQIRRYEGRDKK